MADLVNLIEKKLSDGCFAKKLKKEGCSVSLKDAPVPSITIDMDKPQVPVKQSETKCDYIFIGGSGNVFLVPLELKKGKLDASQIVKQLQAGANIAARIIPRGEHVQFRPVGVCGGKIHPDQRRQLLQSEIRFNGQRPTVELLNCGDPLIKALRKRR